MDIPEKNIYMLIHYLPLTFRDKNYSLFILLLIYGANWLVRKGAFYPTLGVILPQLGGRFTQPWGSFYPNLGVVLPPLMGHNAPFVQKCFQSKYLLIMKAKRF